MIVVSDTSPITALLAVGMEDLLKKLFDEVIIPEAVRDELMREHAVLPVWLRVEPVQQQDEALRFAQLVDRGGAEAIELAKELHADRLLIDERKGRRLAELEGVPVIELVGVVLLARRKQMISSARGLLLRLEQEAGMYLAEDIRKQALRSVGE
jgi:uncharacterized protein